MKITSHRCSNLAQVRPNGYRGRLACGSILQHLVPDDGFHAAQIPDHALGDLRAARGQREEFFLELAQLTRRHERIAAAQEAMRDDQLLRQHVIEAVAPELGVAQHGDDLIVRHAVQQERCIGELGQRSGQAEHHARFLRSKFS